MERVAVFVDYQNVYATARAAFHSRPYPVAAGQVDPLALGRLLVAKRRRPSVLEQVRVYRGLPDPRREATTYAANERQAAAWDRHAPAVASFRRPLRYPTGWPRERAIEKGVDVALAVDFVRLAAEGSYDVGVLFSMDTDLVPALEAGQDYAHVEVAAWKGNRRLAIGGHYLPWCHFLGRADYDAVRDATDYGKAA